MIQNRKNLFNKCLEKVNGQIEKYRESMKGVKESMDANDVHTDYDEEGSKGELLVAFEKYAQYLDNAQKIKEKLSKVDIEHYTEQIKFGSIVETKKQNYFIAAALGEIKMDDGSIIYVISTEAPIFEQLKGKKAGDTFKLNNEEVEILKVR
jgi:transcription elongation GreA/GreB family factor